MNVMGSGLLIVLAILVVSGVIVGVALLITSLARRKACTSRRTLKRRISVPGQSGSDTTELWLR